MTDQLTMPDQLRPEPGTPSLSGRYVYNGGVTGRRGGFVDADMRTFTRAELDDPRYLLASPVFADPAAVGRLGDEPAITLHIDVDGVDPLGVVSGEVAGGSGVGPAPVHFIGRVTGSEHDGAEHRLTVAEFRLTWPDTGEAVDRLEVVVAAGTQPPSARVTFLVVGGATGHGPYAAVRESAFFRDVEVEVDVEEGAVAAEPYDTTTHPVRPPGHPGEVLTLETAYAKAGVSIVRSAESNTIGNAAAGDDRRWSNQELHDAMESHWSSFADRRQWKMWIFLAALGESDSLGGIMFDGDIDEPGGVDRQGTALFTLCPHFHTAEGAYPQANPPAAEAARRELFFNLVHESGHAFNLAHSFQKQRGTPWTPPPWLPLRDAPKALSWMNYPDEASPGGGSPAAAWFYERFPFRFDDGENLFIRHAPGRLVEMGNEAWFQHHARVARGTVDPRLDFRVRTRTDTVELGEAVFVELRLRNASDGPVLAHRNLYPSDGLVEIAVTNPRGERRPWQPIADTRSKVDADVLAPGEAVYRELNLTMGMLGFPFKDPGPYRVEASYRNIDGGTAAAVLQLHVRPPASYDDRRTINSLFDAGVGRVLQVGGSRLMEEANDRIDHVVDRLGETHPASYYLNAVRALPLAKPYKLLTGDADAVQVDEQDPEFVQRRLSPVVERPEEAADVVGHIVYRRLVETYTDAALETDGRAEAHRAQRTMLQMFQERDVVEPVVREVERRVEELE
jgi:hypothetical protein